MMEVGEKFTSMKSLPGSIVLVNTLHSIDADSMMKITPGSTGIIRTVKAVEVAAVMKMLSTATVPAITANVATNKSHDFGNLLK
jgi:hypothetical protein